MLSRGGQQQISSVAVFGHGFKGSVNRSLRSGGIHQTEETCFRISHGAAIQVIQEHGRNAAHILHDLVCLRHVERLLLFIGVIETLES
ncbi:MAG: hypothetical protein OXG78_17195, partial [Chloroflexi bacterium]|nr:hypothetical protein [Chloroflexota bacterium]